MDIQTQELIARVSIANKVKAKVKKLLIKLDNQKSGHLQSSAFFEILELHAIKLNNLDQQALRQLLEKRGGSLPYKEALRCIQYIVPKSKMGSDFLMIQDQTEGYWGIRRGEVNTAKSTLSRTDLIKSRESGISVVSSSISSSIVQVDPQILQKASQIVKDSTEKTMEVIDEEDTTLQESHPDLLSIDLLSQKEKRDALNQKKNMAGMKPEKRISEFQDLLESSPNHLISQIGNRQKSPKEGRKKFSVTKQLHQNDIFNQSFNQDVQPSISETKHSSSSFIAQKSRIPIDFMRSLLEAGSPEKLQLIRQLHQAQLDFRSLNQLRTYLQAEDVIANQNGISIDTYKSNRDKVFKEGSRYREVEPEIMRLVMREDGKVSVDKFAEVVELYNYYPMKVTKDKNKSNEVYYMMLSNKYGGQGKAKETNQDPYLEKLLDTLSSKISGRFTKLADAFKFFDSSLDGSISYHEFKEGLERIGMKVHDSDARSIFSSLDHSGNGELSYSEFCELCEERRRGIDPFIKEALNKSQVVTSLQRHQSDTLLDSGNIYQTQADYETLEKVIRMKPLSSTKSMDKGLFRVKKSNETARFGMPSRIRGLDDMGKIMNQDYAREYLQNKLTRNAFEYQQAHSKSLNARTTETKSSVLRTSKNAYNILQKNLESSIEDLKNSKGDQNSISFAAIQQKQIQLRKRFELPPLLQQLTNSNQLQQQSRNLLSDSTLESSPLHSNISFKAPSILYPKRQSILGDQGSGQRSRNQQDIMEEIDNRLKQLKPSSTITQQQTPTKLPSKYHYMTLGVQTIEKMGKQERDQIVSQYFNVKKQLVESSSKFKI